MSFRVYRTKEGEPEGAAKAWHAMRKGVADLDRRAEVSQAAVSRLAESLASVTETTTLGELLKPLGQPPLTKATQTVSPLAYKILASHEQTTRTSVKRQRGTDKNFPR